MDAMDLLQGAYDIHVHASPDVVPRAMDLAGLRAAAEKAGMSGMLVKDHCTSTVGRAAALNLTGRGACRFFSALALNWPVGGLNPTAAEAALRAGVDVIYFPTYSAAHHISRWGAGKPPTAFPLPKAGAEGISILDSRGNLCPEAEDVLQLIAARPCVLATGHLSPAESLTLLRRAHAAGIAHLLVTHASESVSSFSVDQQQSAVALGAFIEHSFFATTASCPNRISIRSMGEMIRAVGVEHVILSSDFGQPSNGDPVAGFADHLARLMETGFTQVDIRRMTRTNPRRLLLGE